MYRNHLIAFQMNAVISYLTQSPGYVVLVLGHREKNHVIVNCLLHHLASATIQVANIDCEGLNGVPLKSLISKIKVQNQQ